MSSAANIARGLDAVLALTTTALRAAEAARQASDMIRRAQAEDRDLSDDEIAEVQQLRSEAVERWNKASTT